MSLVRSPAKFGSLSVSYFHLENEKAASKYWPFLYLVRTDQPNWHGQSISFLARQYGRIAHAAASLGFASVADLENAVAAYCGT